MHFIKVIGLQFSIRHKIELMKVTNLILCEQKLETMKTNGGPDTDAKKWI